VQDGACDLAVRRGRPCGSASHRGDSGADEEPVHSDAACPAGPLRSGSEKKKEDQRKLHLTVEGDGWGFTLPLDPKKGAAGRTFASQLNAAAFVPNEAATPPPSPPTASAVASSASVADELAKLAALRDQGVLSEEEFLAQKARLLS
jgi:hypothetical protein